MKRRKGTQVERAKRRSWSLLFRCVLWSMLGLLLWCGFVLWTINKYDQSDQVVKSDAAIVLGAALWNDVPSPALKERLDHAFALLEEGAVDNLILSGGLGANGSTKTEAEGMQNYLLDKGAQPDKLLLENQSTSTYENLLFSRSIVQENGWDRIVIVTHDYHSARAKDIAEFIGYNRPQLSATASEVLNPVYNKGREILAYTKWQLDKLLMRVGIASN